MKDEFKNYCKKIHPQREKAYKLSSKGPTQTTDFSPRCRRRTKTLANSHFFFLLFSLNGAEAWLPRECVYVNRDFLFSLYENRSYGMLITTLHS